MSTQTLLRTESPSFLSGLLRAAGTPVAMPLLRKVEAMRGLRFFAGVAEGDLCSLAESALLLRFERGRVIRH